MSDKKEKEKGELLSDLVLKGQTSVSAAADLVVEPEPDQSQSEFAREFVRSLEETEKGAAEIAPESAEGMNTKSWKVAREIVTKFQPVPWFIWRITNFIFSKSAGANKQVPEGMVLGLRRLMFAAASDGFLGEGKKVNNLKRALEILSPDVVGAVSVIHAICRRLASQQFERIWRPILDDAILRAQIGFLVGEKSRDFGGGRGMLAGFAGRSGLAILIASGTLDQAREALEMLAAGHEITQVGSKIFGCDPLQVSAMTLSASGCGRNSAFGTVQYASHRPGFGVENHEQLQWLSAFSIVEKIRMGSDAEIGQEFWSALGYVDIQERADLLEISRSMVRKGHSLLWIV